MSNYVSGALIAALLVGGIVMGLLENHAGLENGSSAPAFSFERFTGGKVNSEELKGKVVLLNFWATWCPPCVEEMPMLVRLANEYESKGVAFVAVNALDDDPVDITAFVNHKQPGVKPFAVYGDPKASAAYKARALPTTYVFDREGKIVASQTGQVSERKVRAWLDKALLGTE